MTDGITATQSVGLAANTTASDSVGVDTQQAIATQAAKFMLLVGQSATSDAQDAFNGPDGSDDG